MRRRGLCKRRWGTSWPGQEMYVHGGWKGEGKMVGMWPDLPDSREQVDMRPGEVGFLLGEGRAGLFS